MILARKLQSALGLFRRSGVSGVAHLAEVQASRFLRANVLRPLSAAGKAARLREMLNESNEFSAVPISTRDVGQVRGSLLFPYLRRRFLDVALRAAAAGRLSPVETAVFADCLFRTWDFGRLHERLPEWRRDLGPTRFAKRMEQMARRVALRTGRLQAAAANLGDPGHGDVADCLLRGDVLDACGRMAEATEAFEQGLLRLTYSPSLRLSYAFHLLKRGDILAGLGNWGLADRILGNYPMRKGPLQWTGEDLEGKSILVIFEHGLGDMIQFSRFLLLLGRRHPGATIFARMPKVLIRLLERSFPEIRFVADEDREPDCDVFIPSILLPVVLGAPDLEPRGGYIDLGPPSLGTVLPGAPRRKRVGVCWRGHPRQYELTRSIPLEQFATIFAVEDVEFVVLLNAPTAGETVFLASFPRVSLPAIRDFAELGTVISGCDIVVTVDTSVVHVAGAGGRPAILLSRPDSCWRWGSSGSRSPWYSTVEVLRHQADMDWNRMLDHAAQRMETSLTSPVENMAEVG